MLKLHPYIFILVLLLVQCKRQESTLVEEDRGLARYINPFICTSNDHGQTDVAAGVPFGMIKPCPDTEPIAHSGYDYSAKEIIGFSNTRFSGVGCRGVGGNLRIFPFVASQSDSIPTRVTYSKNSERAVPGAYAVLLDNGVKAELTGTRQVGYHKYTFPKSKFSGLTIDLASSYVGHIAEEHTILDNGVIAGKVTSVNVCRKGQYTFYYAISFNKEITSVSEQNSKLTFSFSTKNDEAVQLLCALSAVSEENAQNTLGKALDTSFEDVKKSAYRQWNKVMGNVQVETGNDTLKELFYTHLYHATQSPFIINDDNGNYRGSDGKLYNSHQNYYHGWSIWDTFRTKLPLFSLVYPERYSEILSSLKQLYKQGKPDWATETEPFLTIRTEHAILVLLEAYKKGQLPFSLGSIYAELKEEAETLPFKSPDNVLESSLDLWALSQISKELGYLDDHKAYKDRAFEYKTLWKEKFLMMDEDADVMHGDGLYEGTLWQYRWFVPFDMEGIQNMVGGQQVFESQLDYFFDNELFNIGNQPDIQVPYLYNYTDSPWKTQALIHKLLNTKTNNWYGTHEKFEKPIFKKIFTNTPDGYIREMDDDAGTMSSWYVWSTMGLYPIFPGSTELALTTPQFDKITIQTKDKPLQIIANGLSSENIYIQQVTWNGAEINTAIVDFNMISKGGILRFELGDKPNKHWGKNK